MLHRPELATSRCRRDSRRVDSTMHLHAGQAAHGRAPGITHFIDDRIDVLDMAHKQGNE
jgi:hypothetical protein